MLFDSYLKAVGTGPKGNRDLSEEEIFDAITLILQGRIPPEVIGAFLLGLRIKGETSEEMIGAKKATDAMLSPPFVLENSVELSYPYQGKKRHPILLPLIAKEIPDIALAVSIDSDVTAFDHTLIHLKEVGLLSDTVHIADRCEFQLLFSSLNSLRENLKIRTIFNTIEKLHHAAQSRFAIVGAHHTPYFKKYAELFAPSYERLIVLQGDEGSSELFKKSKMIILENGIEVEQQTVDPRDFDIDVRAITEERTAEGKLQMLREPDKNLQNLAKLNAKIIQLAAKRIRSLD